MKNSRPVPCRWLLAVWVAWTTLILAGCGGGANRPYPVYGKITYEDGQDARELAGGTVTFNSEELHKSATGNIQEDGSYRLTSIDKDDGTVPGHYKIMILPPVVSGGGDRDRAAPVVRKRVIDPRYEKLKTTDLQADVAAKSNDIPLQVRRVRR